jgi:hypothetical protein
MSLSGHSLVCLSMEFVPVDTATLSVGKYKTRLQLGAVAGC